MTNQVRFYPRLGYISFFTLETRIRFLFSKTLNLNYAFVVVAVVICNVLTHARNQR
jgi:hypothetical protein